jgi:hypothetical protein
MVLLRACVEPPILLQFYYLTTQYTYMFNVQFFFTQIMYVNYYTVIGRGGVPLLYLLYISITISHRVAFFYFLRATTEICLDTSILAKSKMRVLCF